MIGTRHITPLTLSYGVKTSSSELNKFMTEVTQNIVLLQNETIRLQAELDRTSESYSVENKILSSRIENLDNTKPNKIMINASKFLPISESAVFINRLSGHVSLPILSLFPRTYFKLADTVVLPKSLSVSVAPTANNTNIIDTNLYDALLPGMTSFWNRKVTTPLNGPEFAEVEVTIIFPHDIISNRQCNAIDISPFPVGGIDIVDVEYSSGSSWQNIYGFTPVTHASPVRLVFPAVEIAAIRIKLRQNTPIFEDNQKHFYLGLRSIVASLTHFQQQANFSAVYEFDNASPRTILKSSPVFANSAALSDKSENKKTLCTYTLYSLDHTGHKTTITHFPATINTQKILIEGSLNVDKSGISPQLKGIEIELASS